MLSQPTAAVQSGVKLLSKYFISSNELSLLTAFCLPYVSVNANIVYVHMYALYM